MEKQHQASRKETGLNHEVKIYKSWSEHQQLVRVHGLKLLKGFLGEGGERERARESAHGQWETGAPSEKTGAGDYFKLIVKTLRRSSQVFFFLEMYHLLSELLDMAVKTWAKAIYQRDVF